MIGKSRGGYLALKDAATPTLIFVRHGATAFNSSPATERIRAWLDIPLTKEGLAEGKKVAKDLKDTDIAVIYTSDLRRAAVVAKMIQKEHGTSDWGVSLIKTRALRPWNVGDMAGKLVKKILPKLLDLMIKTPNKTAPGGEAFNDFLLRFIPFVTDKFKDAEKHPNDGVIVLVAHTRNLRAVDAWVKAGMKGIEVDKDILKDPDHLGTGEALQFTLKGRTWVRKVLEQGKKSTSAGS